MTTDSALTELLANIPKGLHGLKWEEATGEEDWADGQSLLAAFRWGTDGRGGEWYEIRVVYVHVGEDHLDLHASGGDTSDWAECDISWFVRLDEDANAPLDVLGFAEGALLDYVGAEAGLEVATAWRIIEMCSKALVAHGRISTLVESRKQTVT